ncbi:hypothetical protein RCO48_02020 [Peribacillus frigoritolerans]|nr:hypothetical protein [Peribacillus frigoritolerans]
MERKVRDSCGKSVAKETPQAIAEGGPPAECGAWRGKQRDLLPSKKNIPVVFRNPLPVCQASSTQASAGDRLASIFGRSMANFSIYWRLHPK